MTEGHIHRFKVMQAVQLPGKITGCQIYTCFFRCTFWYLEFLIFCKVDFLEYNVFAAFVKQCIIV